MFYDYLLWITRLAGAKSDNHYVDTQELLVKLHSSIGLKERAPALALLELQKMLLKDGHSIADPIELWKDQFLRYAAYWGHKGPFVTELENILPPQDDERQEIVDELLESWSRQPGVSVGQTHCTTHRQSDLPSWLRRLTAHVWQLRHAPSDRTPSPEKVKELWNLYEEGLSHGMLFFLAFYASLIYRQDHCPQDRCPGSGCRRPCRRAAINRKVEQGSLE